MQTPDTNQKRRKLPLPMVLGVGALVLGVGGSVLRDRLIGAQPATAESLSQSMHFPSTKPEQQSLSSPSQPSSMMKRHPSWPAARTRA